MSASESPTNIKRLMPWLVAVALFMEQLDATILNVAAPVMAQGFGVEPLSLKGVLTSYTLALAVFIPVSGWLADRYGTKRVFVFAVGLFTLGSLLCGLAVNVPMLVAARTLQGAAGAMMTPVGRLALVRTFPRSEMITAMNYVVIPALIGPLLGPFVGGLIVHWFPWRVIFFINLPFGLIGLWLARRHMPDYREAVRRPLDLKGFLLFGSGIALVSYALEVLGNHSLPWLVTAKLGLIGGLLLAAYGWHARRALAPMLPLHLFRTRTFRVAVLGGFVTRLGIGGMPFLLPMLYQIGLGYPAWQAGLLTMPQALGAIGLKLVSRTVLQQFGHRNILRVNTFFMGLGIMTFSLVGPATPIVLILLLSLFQGVVSSLQFTSMNSLVYADVSDTDASKASSIASTAQQLALSFGVAFGSVVAGLFLTDIPQGAHAAFVGGLHHTFLTLGALTLLAGLSFTALRPDDGNNISNRRHRTPVAELSPREPSQAAHL